MQQQTFLGKALPVQTDMQAEMRLFLAHAARSQDLYRTEPRDPWLDICREDIETMAFMTDWPHMHERCREWLRRDDRARPWRLLDMAAGLA